MKPFWYLYAAGSASTVVVTSCLCVGVQSMCGEYVAGRKECVRLAMGHAAAFGFKDEVLHDAVLLVDRTMSSGTALPPTMLPLLVAACILISARQGLCCCTVVLLCQACRCTVVSWNRNGAALLHQPHPGRSEMLLVYVSYLLWF